MAEKKNGDILYADDFNGKQDKIGLKLEGKLISAVEPPMSLSGFYEMKAQNGIFSQYVNAPQVITPKISASTDSARYLNLNSSGVISLYDVSKDTLRAVTQIVTTPYSETTPTTLKLTSPYGTPSGYADIILSGIASPVNNTDAANKKYVDDNSKIAVQHDYYVYVKDQTKVMYSNEATYSGMEIDGNDAYFGNTSGGNKIHIGENELISFTAGGRYSERPYLVGVATPLSEAKDNITEEMLPYQVANKKYVDDKIAELTAKIEALSK